MVSLWREWWWSWESGLVNSDTTGHKLESPRKRLLVRDCLDEAGLWASLQGTVLIVNWWEDPFVDATVL